MDDKGSRVTPASEPLQHRLPQHGADTLTINNKVCALPKVSDGETAHQVGT